MNVPFMSNHIILYNPGCLCLSIYHKFSTKDLNVETSQQYPLCAMKISSTCVTFIENLTQRRKVSYVCSTWDTLGGTLTWLSLYRRLIVFHQLPKSQASCIRMKLLLLFSIFIAFCGATSLTQSSAKPGKMWVRKSMG